MRGQKYGDEDVEKGLQALAENGGNSAAASRQTGIPATTLRTWKNGNFVDEFVEVRREKRSGFIQEVWDTAEEALKQLKSKLTEMGGKDLAVTVGILVDKGLLMGGEPTEIAEQRARPIIYLPEPDELPMEAEPGTSVEVPQEPGV